MKCHRKKIIDNIEELLEYINNLSNNRRRFLTKLLLFSPNNYFIQLCVLDIVNMSLVEDNQVLDIQINGDRRIKLRISDALEITIKEYYELEETKQKLGKIVNKS